MDFHEIRYLSIFRKSVAKIQVPLNSDKNNGHFTRSPVHIFHHMLLNVSQSEIRQNLQRKSKRAFHVKIFPPPEILAVFEIMWENTVQPDRPQMTIWRMRIGSWITKATNIQ